MPDEPRDRPRSWMAITGMDEAAMRRFLEAAKHRAENPPMYPVARGRVKFFREENGWGGIESEETPGDVWVHRSMIERGDRAHKSLEKGEEVEFAYEAVTQDSWSYAAVWVRRVEPS